MVKINIVTLILKEHYWDYHVDLDHVLHSLTHRTMFILTMLRDRGRRDGSEALMFCKVEVEED